MNPFECCRKCVAPKRHPGCSGSCEEYKKAKEAYEFSKALRRKTLKQEEAVRDTLYKSRG